MTTRLAPLVVAGLATAWAGPLRAQTFQETIDLPSASLALFGVSFTADFLGAPSGTISGTTADLQYTTASLDAADLLISLQAPSAGVPVWSFSGADLGWSGFGTFQATVSSAALDGPIDFGDPAPDFSLYSLHLTAVGFQPLSGQFQASTFQVDVDRWVDLGLGLAGSGGLEPQLDPTASLAAGSPMAFDLSAAPPGAQAFLGLGVSAQHLPFLGGTLVPDPVAVVPLTVDAGGVASFALTWPAGVPKGISLYAQAWVTDPGAPQGFSASSAFKAVTP